MMQNNAGEKQPDGPDSRKRGGPAAAPVGLHPVSVRISPVPSSESFLLTHRFQCRIPPGYR